MILRFRDIVFSFIGIIIYMLFSIILNNLNTDNTLVKYTITKEEIYKSSKSKFILTDSLDLEYIILRCEVQKQLMGIEKTKKEIKILNTQL